MTLMALFPRGVAAAELTADPFTPLTTQPPEAAALAQARKLLTEPEWQSIAHCRAARIRDYTAGRLCAHQALEQLGLGGVSVLSASDRRPLWPPGISGSITHTEGYAAAVVGLRSNVGSLGLDTERIGDIEPALWPEICTSAELEQVSRWPGESRAAAVALCFVAKEAFYKAQFVLAGEPLEFSAIGIELPHEPRLGEGVFQVHPLRALRLQPARGGAAATDSWCGRFRRHDPYVSAGIALPLV